MTSCILRHLGRQTAALERLVRSDAIAVSGFQRLAAAIDESADVLENQALQGFVSLPLASAEILLGIEADGSKIDVLAADPLMLERYLTEASLDLRRVTILLGDIGVARSRSDGAGALEIVRAAIAGLLPTGAFDRDLTRFGSSGVDPTYASARVLHAIPDLAPSDADRIAATPAGERAQYARLSGYFASTGRHFSLVTRIGWGADAAAERRLPIEISTSGKVVVLAGPN